MTKAQILQMPLRLECSACGARAEAACYCGAPYVRAGQRAATAIAHNPQKSDRAIAAELGIDHKTVGKARKSTGEYSPVEKRTGKDGKARRVPVPVEEMPTEEEADQAWQNDVYDQACFLLDERMSDATRQRFFAHIKRRYQC